MYVCMCVCVVAKRKTLFDDRPVEISVREWSDMQCTIIRDTYCLLGTTLYTIHQATHLKRIPLSLMNYRCISIGTDVYH